MVLSYFKQYGQPTETLNLAQWDYADQMYCLKEDSTIVFRPV